MSKLAELIERRKAGEDAEPVRVPICLDRRAQAAYYKAQAERADAELRHNEAEVWDSKLEEPAPSELRAPAALARLEAAREVEEAASSELRAAVIILELRRLPAVEHRRVVAQAGPGSTEDELLELLAKEAFVRALDQDGEPVAEVTRDNLVELLDCLTAGELSLVLVPLRSALGGVPDFPTWSAASERTSS